MALRPGRAFSSAAVTSSRPGATTANSCSCDALVLAVGAASLGLRRCIKDRKELVQLGLGVQGVGGQANATGATGEGDFVGV